MIYPKSYDDLQKMREGGNILKTLLKLLEDNICEGITTLELDKLAFDYIKKNKAVPSFLNYNGFPSSICISIDDEVVHGIPKKNRKLQKGQIVSIDGGVYYKGFHTDAARTFAVGEVSKEKARLIRVTEECFFEGIKSAIAGNRIIDISTAIQNTAHEAGFSVVEALVGHGIGKNLHEEPSVPNFVTKSRGIMLTKNITLAIEPMINYGGLDVYFCEDGWTVKTKDAKPSAHYENTVVVGDGECEILTL